MAQIYFLGADNKAVLIVRWNGLVVLRLLLCKAHLPPVATAKKRSYYYSTHNVPLKASIMQVMAL